MRANCNPIGIFDSGLGGLSVMKALRQKLPQERFLYLADSARSPYGEKDCETIIEYSIQVTRFLLQYKCKCVVVACNTATAAAISTLRGMFSIPFVGMEPAVKTAAEASSSGRIGILATRATFNGNHFLTSRELHSGRVTIHEQTGEGLVEMVEQGRLSGKEVEKHLSHLIKPMLSQGIDQLVLGCTHYPFFTEALKKILPEEVTVIDPAPAVARQTRRILEKYNLLCSARQGSNLYFSTGEIKQLQTLASVTGEGVAGYDQIALNSLESLRSETRAYEL